eukprot:gnl/TRDRNA2_/TRDRNA2_131364_c0_seq2.p1 gnl/TRDRNA2_/TRDRNA2_131364_c0~~gnl/TRDRNA2_/TRDRNA2_131364_c0_seq2.p1  ORF type:complete len:299 (+),score=92.24 gnl/TRDRNA2_/TRDRNA2_131364_c0_seq2:185-1081(+)
MTGDWNKLAGLYKNSKRTLIANADCAGTGQSLCGKMGVGGYPTLKAIIKDKDPWKPSEYNGGRDFMSLKRYVEANLAGPECSLEDKEGCEKEELQILEESERMTSEQRRARMKELEAQKVEKEKMVKDLQKEVKDVQKAITYTKLGGEKPDVVLQLTNDGDFRDHCESRTCVIAFLPHILEGGAKERNAHLKAVDAVFKHAKAEGFPVGFMWSQGGDQFDIEEKMALQFGFPAMIAINLKKGKYGVHRGTWDKTKLIGFLSSMMTGRVPLQDVPKGLPPWSKVDKWDGKDGEVPQEDL